MVVYGMVTSYNYSHLQLSQLPTDISVTEKGKLQVTGRVTVKVGYWWRR